jgi:SHAQKYF class myb-like DNA-binding protein
MGNLSLLSAGSTSGGASPADGPDLADGGGGYASDDFVQGSSSASRERKKGVPWTEEEHRRFLLGLQKLGKGDWRGISRNFVVSRTPTQVASHAQKYFIRQSNMSRRKRRSSLFDMVPDESMDLPPLPGSQEPEASVLNQQPLPPPVEEEVESMESDTSAVAESSTASALMPENLHPSYPVILPAYFSPFLQFSVPFWPNQKDGDDLPQETHEIVKPVAVHSKNPINVDELVGMSKLSIGEPGQETVSTSLSLNLLGDQNRQSAFHANPQTRAQA